MKYQFKMKKDHQTLSEKIIVSIIKKNRKQNVFRYLFNGLPSRNRTYN